MRSLDSKRTLGSGINSFFKVVNWVGYISLSGMILLTTVNVFGRYIFKKPLLGEVDMVELSMAIFGGVAMFLAALQRHHVRVDVLLVHFTNRSQTLLGRIASLTGFVTWTLLACLTFLDGLDKLQNGSQSATLFLPLGPFEMALAVLIFLFGLIFLKQAFNPEGSEEKEEGGSPL